MVTYDLSVVKGSSPIEIAVSCGQAKKFSIRQTSSFVNMKWYKLQDEQDNEQGLIKRRRFNHMVHYIVEVPQYPSTTIYHDMENLNDVYKVDGKQVVVDGDWRHAKDFTIKVSDKMLATITQSDGALKIEIADEDATAFVLSICAAMILLIHREQGKQ